jgi:hypothetical protein
MVDINKGNVLRNTRYDNHALILALTKDGKRAKLHVYGKDEPVWHPLAWYEVAEQGLATCYKCGGSGKFYLPGPGPMGNAVVNGAYQGKTDICFACQGKGKQDDTDRTRCHFYWHRYGRDVMPDDFTADGSEDDSMPYGPMDAPDTSDFS